MINALELQTRSTLVAPNTLRIQRLLPGPATRIFAYLADGNLRRQWLASGDLPSEVGAPFTLTWRNDELSGGSEHRPEGFPAEHSAQCRLLEIDPPHRLAYSWGEIGIVTIDLEERGADVLLTLTHDRLPDDAGLRGNVFPGWHAHLDLLEAIVAGDPAPLLWPHWCALRAEYADSREI